MKKILAILMAFCLVFSVVGTATFVSAEGETTEEVTTVEPTQINMGMWYSGGWGHTNASVKKETVYDNVFYSEAAKCSVSDVSNFKFGNIYPYYNNKVTGNELKDFVANNGDMRTYVKNTSGHDMTFKVGIKIATTNGKPTAWKEEMKQVTIAGDNKWYEVRMSFADWNLAEDSDWYKVYAGDDADEFGYKELYFFVSGLGADDFTATTDELYFTKLEVYNGPLTGAVDEGANNANREIKQTALINKASGNGVSGITAAEVGIYDNEYYTKAMKYYNATTGYQADESGNGYVYQASSVIGNEFVDFMKYHGDMRTYVKNVSDHEMTFKLGVKVQYNGTAGSGHPSALQDVSVPNDGKWHEIILSYDAFNLKTSNTIYPALSGDEGYPLKSIWMRISALDDDFTSKTDELYFTPLEVYNRAIAGTAEAEKSDANIKLEQSAVIGDKDGGGVSGVSVAEVKIADNKYCRTAMKYYNPVIGSYNFTGNAYPYQVKTVTGEEFKDFIKNHGDMRTYVKNVSDHTMTFNIGIKIHFTGKESGYSAPGKKVEIPGDGKWHEVRISYSELGVTNANWGNYKAMAATDMENYKVDLIKFNISNLNKTETSSGVFTASTDELYFTPLEIYNRSIDEPLTTDFAREYVQAGLMTNYYGSWKNDDKSLSHNNTTYDGEYPIFFNKAVTYTQIPDVEVTGKQNGYVNVKINDSAKAQAFADWYYNDNAELRFYIKSDEDTEFKFGLYIGGGGELYSNVIQVKGNPDWQEVTVKRSDFTSRSDGIESVIKGSGFEPILFFRATTNTFANTDQIHLSQAVEFYSNKAYAKGDANCDNNVDVIDLIRIKKQAASTNVNLVNGDIDNNAAVNANDLTLIRKRLLSGKWS